MGKSCWRASLAKGPISVFTEAVVCLLYMQMADIVISYGKLSVTKCRLSAKDQAYILALRQ